VLLVPATLSVEAGARSVEPKDIPNPLFAHHSRTLSVYLILLMRFTDANKMDVKLQDDVWLGSDYI